MNGPHNAALLLLILALLAPFTVFAGQDTDDKQPSTEAVEAAAKEPEKEAKDPNRGRILPIPIFITEPAIGDGLGLALTYFHRLHEKFVLGLRLEYSTINGRAPFFAVPWVSLRGIPAMRYQVGHAW